ncbi:helix-turn-helix transcriptional regulator [Candidatus Bathycorpusculum sp.]|uniref:helix-turn-helix transcriptional regulator n=1 Tax=Candidatus Bathycorpusculum sp. TaxID=2994959 RepID=UPI00282DF334|nr:helix-turn-helix transcriptional regulator [Candidatus Termitimicrobium sp.]MCL2685113.1 helix-turn-helix transcriptional regulator [Candidatus Termitimicrobium sp.]MDR2719685.1 helix-turn-helix transcriptional regulator [Nitrososphaerota archaeon]
MKNKKMKLARVACDLSQEQLAEKIGVTRQTISLIESGNYNPTIKLCILICKALNTTLDQLFWDSDSSSASNDKHQF